MIGINKYKLHIIARDIPVFRKVNDEFAYYFENSNNLIILEKVTRE